MKSTKTIILILLILFLILGLLKLLSFYIVNSVIIFLTASMFILKGIEENNKTKSIIFIYLAIIMYIAILLYFYN